MSECSHQCGTCQNKCKQAISNDGMLPLNPRSRVRKVYGIVSGKGGVGKSMVTCQIAVTMQRQGKKVGILDADITGPSIPRAFRGSTTVTSADDGIIPSKSKTGIEIISMNLLLNNEVDPVLWRGPVISSMVSRFWSEVIWDVDYLFIDMPPGTGDIPMSVFQQIPLDGIIVVATPQQLVSMIVEKAIIMSEKTNVPIVGLVENMSYIECNKCGERLYPFGKGKLEEIAETYKLKLLANIPIDETLTELIDSGLIESYKGNWMNQIAQMI